VQERDEVGKRKPTRGEKVHKQHRFNHDKMVINQWWKWAKWQHVATLWQ
jgi:hypothetical protein